MTRYQDSEELKGSALGKTTEYTANYAPGLLHPVPRSLNRDQLELPESFPFHGVDIWHGYELSWLNSRGKPVVALARFAVPATSPNIIESKSFKLYLNSLNQTRFDSQDIVKETLENDLSKTAGSPVTVELIKPDDIQTLSYATLPGDNIDDLDISIEHYEFLPDTLKQAAEGEIVEETLNSHLLKSNCLITSQPDWGSVIIDYKGPAINREKLLRYLISFRQHNEFHEQCVERIYSDIVKYCQPEKLTVQALYTRRGGLDINPFRSSDPAAKPPARRINRQ